MDIGQALDKLHLLGVGLAYAGPDGKAYRLIDTGRILSPEELIVFAEGVQATRRVLSNDGLYEHTIVVRRSDKKEFRVRDLAHWSDIQAADGETDSVKWYGNGYVSATKGHGYDGYEERA